jgi:protein-L-isoaspartate(D-aspartate) O-methyltransferase
MRLMNTTATTADTSPDALRASMVEHILNAGHARRAPVEQALRQVPRHRFLPAATAVDAYADMAVITKRGSDGAALSCASVPTVVAMMLDQLDVHPGQRILEIGAGTGYNAALLAHLTGPAGQVTTIDIDPDVTAGARRALEATGYDHVHVITRDGALGAPEAAPYDRIIFTVGAWDLPPAFYDQLTPAGRLVVPLRWRGQTRSIAFTRHNDLLRSDSVQLCGFVPMIGQHGEHSANLDTHGHTTLHWDTDQPIDPATLPGILDQHKTQVWSQVLVSGNESFDGIWLRLTSTEPGTCRITTTPDNTHCTPAIPARSPALTNGNSLAYLTLRKHPHNTQPAWELGATGHGPTGPDLANRINKQIHAWNSNRTTQPTITAHPTDTLNTQQSDHVIHKQHTRLVITY